MFHSAAVRLTAWYLGIIMALSLGCSAVIYRVSSANLAQDANRQTSYFDSYLAPEDLRVYRSLRLAQLHEDLDHIKANLLVFNLLVLIGGGALSYALARRTLTPIEDALESQKRFAADASHELRTPLTAMQTEIEVALRDPKLNKAGAVKLLKSNLEEVAKLRSLSDGLLRLASRNGKQELNQAVSLKLAAEQAANRLAKAAKSKNITFKTSLKPAKVRGDAQSLTDLIAILIDNAVKYSPEGSTVEITSGRKGKTVFLEVKDKGIGIKASDLPHIFERFFRADTSRAKSSTDGYGLGLAIAKKITELHGGHIETASAPGKGSTFTIFLPAS